MEPRHGAVLELCGSPVVVFLAMRVQVSEVKSCYCHYLVHKEWKCKTMSRDQVPPDILHRWLCGESEASVGAEVMK